LKKTRTEADKKDAGRKLLKVFLSDGDQDKSGNGNRRGQIIKHLNRRHDSLTECIYARINSG